MLWRDAGKGQWPEHLWDGWGEGAVTVSSYDGPLCLQLSDRHAGLAPYRVSQELGEFSSAVEAVEVVEVGILVALDDEGVDRESPLHLRGGCRVEDYIFVDGEEAREVWRLGRWVGIYERRSICGVYEAVDVQEFVV